AGTSAPATVFRSTDGGLSWVGHLRPPFSLIGLEIDPHDALTAYGVGSAYVGDQLRNSVFVTHDGGATWVASGSGVPATPQTCVRIDPTDSTVLYCGSLAGVYRSTDTGTTWNQFGLGFPNSPVTDMRLLDDGSVLRVATFGRGVWEIQVHPRLAPKITSAT